MEKEEKINKVKETIRVFFQVLSFVHWIIAIICGSVATVILVIIMPTISLLVAILLGVVIIVLFAAFIAIAKIVMLKEREIYLMEEERSQARESPEIKVLDAKIRGNIIGLRVKNVGAGGGVRVSVVDNGGIKARWFKSYNEMKDIGGKEKVKLARGDECYVGITRGVKVIDERIIPNQWHYIKVRFSEANQIFKYKFRITEEGIKDLEFLGEG